LSHGNESLFQQAAQWPAGSKRATIGKDGLITLQIYDKDPKFAA
jgi:hypothetical protein